MSTTAIFVELLIIGIHAAMWIGFLVVTFLPTSFALDLSELAKWNALVTMAILAICYSLGILVDRLADTFFGLLRPGKILLSSRVIRRLHGRFTRLSSEVTPFELAIREGKAFEVFSYYRSRIRITRSLAINGLLTAAFAALYFSVSAGSALNVARVPIVLGSLIVALFSFLATGLLEIAYESRRIRLSKRLEGGVVTTKSELHSSSKRQPSSDVGEEVAEPAAARDGLRSSRSDLP